MCCVECSGLEEKSRASEEQLRLVYSLGDRRPFL